MIKFKRGSTKSWQSTEFKLGDGQPGYDKDKNKLKIGDGENSWINLPYIGGLTSQEILNEENIAKLLYAQDAENTTLITYGDSKPNSATIGKVYLAGIEPEINKILKVGIKDNWVYKQYESGIVECCCSFTLTTTLDKAIEDSNLFQNTIQLDTFKYPFTFTEVPVEVVTLQNTSGLVWLANTGANTETTSGNYTIISPYKQSSESDYSISILVSGRSLPPMQDIAGYKHVDVYLKDTETT